MLKTTRPSGLSAPKAFRTENDKVVEGGSRVDEMVVDLSKSQKFVKSQKISKAWKAAKVVGLEKPSFLTFNTRLAFMKMGFSRTHDGGLLAIVEVIKNWKRYLEAAS